MTSAAGALARLRAGNRRFVDGIISVDRFAAGARRQALAAGQAPFAIILGCADSRVPAEIVFDHSLGDLFVIREDGLVVVGAGYALDTGVVDFFDGASGADPGPRNPLPRQAIGNTAQRLWITLCASPSQSRQVPVHVDPRSDWPIIDQSAYHCFY